MRGNRTSGRYLQNLRPGSPKAPPDRGMRFYTHDSIPRVPEGVEEETRRETPGQGRIVDTVKGITDETTRKVSAYTAKEGLFDSALVPDQIYEFGLKNGLVLGFSLSPLSFDFAFLKEENGKLLITDKNPALNLSLSPGDETTIGRGAGCDMRIDDGAFAKKHVAIIYYGNGLVGIKAFTSRAGVKVSLSN